ncbi:hypothetical protein DFH08DRAFT_825442 [Mycena albidolilacea]|uniref:Uncharacterized protein n=1 Tax=Mycena albidolilacea TaxID=1033008 RepID=A0AAD6Z391_9AGAR|nr:hypothetical protein DFH08DRAFT_825442 [Mycena albidolilacea]
MWLAGQVTISIPPQNHLEGGRPPTGAGIHTPCKQQLPAAPAHIPFLPPATIPALHTAPVPHHTQLPLLPSNTPKYPGPVPQHTYALDPVMYASSQAPAPAFPIPVAAGAGITIHAEHAKIETHFKGHGRAISHWPVSSPEPFTVSDSVTQKLTHSILTNATKEHKEPARDNQDSSSTTPKEEEPYSMEFGQHLRTRIQSLLSHGLLSSPMLSQKACLKCLDQSWVIITKLGDHYKDHCWLLRGDDFITWEHQALQERDDMNKMKTSAINWLMKMQTPMVSIPTSDIPDPNKKTGHSFDSPITAEVLRPMEYPATVETYESIRAGDKLFPINSKIPPSWIPRSTPMIGSTSNTSFLRVLCQFLQQKKSIKPSLQKGKKCHTQWSGCPCPCNLGYVCTQLYFSLPNLGAWSPHDSSFSYQDFYWSIINLFQGREGQGILDNFH